MLDISKQFKEFKVFEVAFFSEKRELQKLLCTVKSIESNRIVINANNQKNKNIFASSDDELQLHIYTEQGVYSATSKVLLVSKGIISTEYVITYPENSKHSQRREYFRAEIAVNFALTVFNDGDSEQVIINSTTKNICGKGMSYIADEPLGGYSTLEVEFFFQERVIRSFAELVYTQPIMVGEKQQYINAFTLTDISKHNIEFIIKKCFLHQLDLRKKPITPLRPE